MHADVIKLRLFCVLVELMAAAASEEITRGKEEVLIKKIGVTSVIWTLFGFKESDVEQKYIICKVCRVTVIAKRGNTSNLFYHFTTKHVLEYQESQKLSPPQRLNQLSGKKKGGPIHQQTDILEVFSKATPSIDITHPITCLRTWCLSLQWREVGFRT